MSTIRRQSIISSFVVYFGFALGLLNTFLYIRQGGFSREEYGLVGLFVAIAQLMYAIASTGMSAYLTKFFPYYKAHLPDEKNDQLTIALIVPTVGFVLVMLLGFVFKDVVVNKIFSNSPQLLDYYYWLFPFGFGFTIFMILEAYAWQQHKAVVSNFLKEVVFRGFITVLIILFSFGLIRNFEAFIGLYSFVYVVLALYLFYYFRKRNQLYFTFKLSKVTRRFRLKIKALVGYVWSAGIIFNLASVIDTIIIAAVLPEGVAMAAFFTVAQYMASLIQAPQRAVISASVGHLSQAWKDKDFPKINRIYHRSSINQLLFSCAMFSLIWINFEDGIYTFQLQPEYLAAKWTFFFLGMTRILDMGTGLNAQIISTSSFWKYEFNTGIVLLALMLPLNYFFTIRFGLMGPAIANLISFTIYNAIRYLFLLRKFSMQPFNAKTGLAIVVAGVAFLLSYLPFKDVTGLHWMVLRSTVFCLAFAVGTIYLQLSPDLLPVWQTVRKRLRF